MAVQVCPDVAADVPEAAPAAVAHPVPAVVSEVRPPAAAVVVVAAAAVRVPRVLSGVRVDRPSVDANPRSSVVKSSTRWKHPRLAACASVKAMGRSCGCAADHR